MDLRPVWRTLSLAATVPLSIVAVMIAWRSIERFYAVYAFAQGRTPTDDLSQAHINVRLEVSAWGIVMVLVVMVLLLLRFWRRSRRSNVQQLA